MAVKARSPKTAGEIEAELRRVSILFADIQGSTELIQHLHPEAVADILDPAVRAMIEEVERFEGVISDRRGDGVMAIFGAPSAVEDHAVRACLAGLAIRDRMSLEGAGKDQGQSWYTFWRGGSAAWPDGPVSSAGCLWHSGPCRGTPRADSRTRIGVPQQDGL
jgi:hypothetical protein